MTEILRKKESFSISNWQLKTPVVLIVFKRPDTTEKVFEIIRQLEPPKLLVIADGARADRHDEAEKCAAARAIIERVDWECEVIKNYSEINLGCAKRVSSGLDWVFNQVEDAIILEDDCVPHPTFFRFCEELLERYRYDNRIVSISGQNVQFGRRRTEYSYYFSRYNHCWGWATWRRAWHYFDFDMKLWSEVKNKNFLNDILLDREAVSFWTEMFQSTNDGHIDSWAYRWTFSCWIESGLNIISNVNLVANVGFGNDGTNLKKTRGKFVNKYANMSTKAMNFPLQHSPFVLRDSIADNFTQNTLYRSRLLKRFTRKLKQVLCK